MLPLLLLTVLAATPSTAANIGRLQPRDDTEECCPCPTLGSEGATVTVTPATVTVTEVPGKETATPATVTVTEAREKETITVSHTVTEHGNTVYLTQETSPEPTTVVVTEGVSTVSEPSVKTVTIQEQIPQPSDEASVSDPGAEDTVTKTIGHGDREEDPTTVTVSIKADPDHGATITVTAGGKPSESPDGSENVTVTIGGEPSGLPDSHEDVTVTVPSSQGDLTVTVPSSGPQETEIAGHDTEQVVTQTVHGVEEEHLAPATIIVSLEPSNKTVSIDKDHVYTETIETPHYITLTAAPETETVSVVKSIDHYRTETRTVSTPVAGGNDINIDIDVDIEIIIINTNTGERTCRKKDSGKPCSGDSLTYAPPTASKPTEIPCPTDALTSFATVYNTVLVTGTAGPNHNTTSGLSYAYALPSGTDNGLAKERKPRAPMSKWW